MKVYEIMLINFYPVMQQYGSKDSVNLLINSRGPLTLTSSCNCTLTEQILS